MVYNIFNSFKNNKQKEDVCMEIITAKALWSEDVGFVIDRKNIGNHYYFLHYYTPVEILTAKGIIKTNGHSFMVINKFSPQWYRVIDKPMIHDWMHFTGELNSLMKNADLDYDTIYEIQNGIFITKIIQDIEIESLKRDKYSQQIIGAKLTQLIMLAGRSVNARHDPTVDTSIKNELIKIRTQIQQTYYDKWTVDDMAALMHMSNSRFYDLYKSVFGITPKKDLRNLRIEHAKRLLVQHKYTIKEVAEMIGFQSEYYFIKKFKEITGKTPGQYVQSN